MTPIVGAKYRLADSPLLGDYANELIEVEKGPRGSGDTLQYRVSWGPGVEVDWINVSLFDGAVLING